MISAREKALDTQVATHLMGYRWVRWNRQALGGGPLYSPGRFLARPDDFMGHFMEPAGHDTPLHAQPLGKVPRWSTEVEHAFEVAEAAGLFADGRAVLLRDGEGEWTIEFSGSRLASRDLAQLLCRASLKWHEVVSGTARGRRSPMPRRPLPDSSEWRERRLARSISRLAIGALIVLGLVILVLYLVA